MLNVLKTKNRLAAGIRRGGVFDKTKKQELNKKIHRGLHFGMVALLIAGLLSLWLPQRVLASCGGTNPVHMYLLWDPTSGYTFPSAQGWQLTTAYNGRFIRGAPVSEFGQTGGDGARPFTPSVDATVGTPNETGTTNAGNNPQQATTSHIHPDPTYVVHPDDNGDPSNPDVPAFRTLQLMKYNPGSGSSCIPTTIPAGAIALFESTSLPADFTQYSAQNAKAIRVDSSVTTGGGDTVTNRVTNISGLSADTSGTATQGRFNLFPNTDTSNPDHTHGPPSPNNFTTTAVSSLPPYVQPIMAQATADIPTLALNISALFDGDPGPAWTITSAGGGPFYHQFIRPGTSVDLSSQGSLTHTDPDTVVVSGPATPVGSSTLNLGGGGLAVSDHTHNITFSFGSVSNIPPYVNFVVAQKVSFTLNHYQWYVESGSATVNDPWPNGSSLEISPDIMLPAIPAAYKPPSDIKNTQLRLRIQILVGLQSLSANGTGFKLQYQATPSNDCLSGEWTDVAASSSAVWQYGTNGVVDGTTLSPGDTVFGSTTPETFSKSASGAGTPNSATSGQTLEYDWLIKDNGALTATEYHFRVVEVSGTPLGSYIRTNPTYTAECPGAETAPGIDQQLRHGEFFLTNPNQATGQDPDQGFSWVE